MGKAGDANAAVDSKGREFGVAGLRVVVTNMIPFSSLPLVTRMALCMRLRKSLRMIS